MLQNDFARPTVIEAPTPYYGADDATATFISLKSADAAKAHCLHGIIISTDTAGEYYVQFGSTKVFSVFLPANGGGVFMFTPFYLKTGVVNQALTLVKPVGAKTRVTSFVSST